jgi:hypothetical protein
MEAPMSDFLVEAAGVLGIAAALVHGYLGETRIFAVARIEPRRVRLLLRLVWQCGVIAWIALGALLLCAPALHSARARIAIIVASAAVYAAGAVGNAWASRGRHFGWAWLSIVVVLALAGI